MLSQHILRLLCCVKAFICVYVELVKFPDSCCSCPAIQVTPTFGTIFAISLCVRLVQEVTNALSSHLASAEVVQQQACIRPLSPDGSPIIGQHPFVAGAYIATGVASHFADQSILLMSCIFSLKGCLHSLF